MNKKIYIKSLFIRVLVSIILFLAVSIFVNYSDKNLLLFKNNIYDKTFKFNKISALYKKYFGSVVNKPSPSEVLTVNKEINYNEYNSYKDGVKLSGVGAIYPYKSGIVVFIGEKEDYGNTIIIQGMDGIDYWYGNVEDVNVKLYDYIESDNIIANAKDNTLYVVFMKDGKVLDYEEYIK